MDPNGKQQTFQSTPSRHGLFNLVERALVFGGFFCRGRVGKKEFSIKRYENIEKNICDKLNGSSSRGSVSF